MNGHCCQSRLTLLKWPALLALALMLNQSEARPVLAAASEPGPTSVLSRTVQQGPVTLEVQLDRNEALVAQSLRLTLTAKAPEGVKVRFPEPNGQLGEFDVTAVENQFDVPDGTERTWKQVLQLESLTSGAKQLPAVTLAYTDERASSAQDAAGSISTPAMSITIISEVEAGADPTRFRDIKGVASLAEPETTSHGWLIGTIAGTVLLALAGLWLFVRTRRKLTPAQWALGELDRLEASGLIAAGEFDTFFCDVTDILREYIERQFAIRAPRQTTREFLAGIESGLEIGDDQRRLLAAFLKLSDVVKYARFDVNGHDARRALAQCRNFIESTSDVARVTASVSDHPVVSSDNPKTAVVA